MEVEGGKPILARQGGFVLRRGMTDRSLTLRTGWTTGACAAAAAKGAAMALMGQAVPGSVSILLPKGQCPHFDLVDQDSGDGWAVAGVVKDAGDDPDITHGATIRARVEWGVPGSGIHFRAGPGVGTVTKPGLPLPVGEPAINPVPRQMIMRELRDLSQAAGMAADLVVELSIPNGERLAQSTLNPRLGIVGGLSILGTTGLVIPYSCSAWIDSIHRGIDVARAVGHDHVAGVTGSSSERAVLARTGLPPDAIIDMGDFVGGMLKYLRTHPIPRLTIGGGFAKLVKLGQGAMDLHSKRSQVDLARLAAWAGQVGADQDVVRAMERANTALEVLILAQDAGLPLGWMVAEKAAQAAQAVLGDAPIALEVLAFDRSGQLVGQYPT